MDNIDDINDAQITKAVEVIRKQADDTDKQLLDDEDIILQFAFNRIPKSSNNNSKIIKIVLPHNVEVRDVCLFVGEGPDKSMRQRENINDTIATYEDKLRKMGLAQVSEVIPLLKLKLEYQTYESRRALVSRFDTFLADDSVMRFLPSLLGKVFYGNKKHPIPVKMRRGNMERELKKALQTKQCVISSKGACNSVTVAQMSLDDKQVVTNVRCAIDKIIESAPGGKDNIRSIHLLRRGTVALPLYMCTAEKTAEVETPDITPPKVEEEPLIEEVSTIKGQVSVSKDGTITIYRDGKIVKIADLLAVPETKGKKRTANQKVGESKSAPAKKVKKEAKNSNDSDKNASKPQQKKKPDKKKTQPAVTEIEVEPSSDEFAEDDAAEDEAGDQDKDEVEEEGSDVSELEFSSDADSEAGDLSADDDDSSAEPSVRGGSDEISGEDDSDAAESADDDSESSEELPPSPPPKQVKSVNSKGGKSKPTPPAKSGDKSKPISKAAKIQPPIKKPGSAKKMVVPAKPAKAGKTVLKGSPKISNSSSRQKRAAVKGK